MAKENWLKFDFPNECKRSDFLKRAAAGSHEGMFTPFFFCVPSKEGEYPCGAEAAKECARRCEEFYDKHIEENKE